MPNKSSILESMKEFDRVGQGAFLAKYAGGQPPRAHYPSHNDIFYPLKALWAAAHRPAIQTSQFNTREATRGVTALGFQTIIAGDSAKQYEEGEQQFKEIKTFVRNPSLVADAKKEYGFDCVACGFNFAKAYGEIGKGYIECHHLRQVALQGGENTSVSIEHVTVLCGSAHPDSGRQTRNLSP